MIEHVKDILYHKIKEEKKEIRFCITHILFINSILDVTSK